MKNNAQKSWKISKIWYDKTMNWEDDETVNKEMEIERLQKCWKLAFDLINCSTHDEETVKKKEKKTNIKLNSGHRYLQIQTELKNPGNNYQPVFFLITDSLLIIMNSVYHVVNDTIGTYDAGTNVYHTL